MNSKTQVKKTLCGIDGEGQDTPDGRHVYTYLSCVDEYGKIVAESKFDPEGLSLLECADVILQIPKTHIAFGFMFSYDSTKIIEDLPLEKRFYLLRPDARRKRACPKCEKEVFTMVENCPKCKIPLKVALHSAHVPVTYKYPDGKLRRLGLGFFNGSLTVADKGEFLEESKWAKTVRIHDCFKFFGVSFVEALKSWETGTVEEIDRIASMKGKRGDFENESPGRIMSYCRDECRLLAQMMRKLITAHIDAGIPLRQYFGAGSTASALLKKYQVDLYRGPGQCQECGWKFTELRKTCPKCDPDKTIIRQCGIKDLPGSLQIAILSAYFGGRFENSIIGFVDEPLISKDIASAYPYALTFMPCLRCGRWEKIDKWHPGIRASLALVRVKVGKIPKKERKGIAWLPLPCRTEDGSIAYGSNFEGWAWAPEVIEALEGWPEYVKTAEAWIYRTECDHKPFGFLPEGFRQRIAWGKEGRGLALKLGMNAVYGKAAQVRGGSDPPFQSWVWAGMTTSTCRAMILRLLRKARDRWNVYAIATDGIYTSEELGSPEPLDTGTFGLLDSKGKPKAALGAWETKTEGLEQGGFFVKPGLYWRVGTEEKELRARGIGRKETFAAMRRIEEAFLNWDKESWEAQVQIESRRFYGAKHSVHMYSVCRSCENKGWPGPPEKGCEVCGKIGKVRSCESIRLKNGFPAYGLWDVRTAEIAFDPHPKRVRESLGEGRHVRLCVRDLGGIVSEPYMGETSPEGMDAKEYEEMMSEQPDWG